MSWNIEKFETEPYEVQQFEVIVLILLQYLSEGLHAFNIQDVSSHNPVKVWYLDPWDSISIVFEDDGR